MKRMNESLNSTSWKKKMKKEEPQTDLVLICGLHVVGHKEKRKKKPTYTNYLDQSLIVLYFGNRCTEGSRGHRVDDCGSNRSSSVLVAPISVFFVRYRSAPDVCWNKCSSVLLSHPQPHKQCQRLIDSRRESTAAHI